MPKPNYSFEKRQRELEKKRKKAEKEANKAARKNEAGQPAPQEGSEPVDPSQLGTDLPKE